MNEPLMTLDDVAEMLSVSPAVVYGLRYRREAPPAMRIGRELRFRRTDVERWLDARCEEKATDR